jgi:hypothetical protein
MIHCLIKYFTRLFVLFAAIQLCAYDSFDEYYYESYYNRIFNIDSVTIRSSYLYPNFEFSTSDYLHPIKASFRYKERGNFRIDGETQVNFSENMHLFWHYRIADSPLMLDGYVGKKRNSIGDIRADFLSSALVFDNEYMTLSFNRGRIETSQFGENMMINAHNYISDNVILLLHNEDYSFDNVIMFLQPVDGLSKAIVYHRYGYVKDTYKIGFSDLSVFTFTGFNSISYKYFAPYSFLYEVEENYSGSSNIMWRFDFSYIWGNNMLWAEILIDDYALSRQSPSKLGGMIGFRNMIGQYPLITTLTKINRWVYNYGYDKPELKFIDLDRPLGHSIGPDAVQLSISSKVKFKTNSVLYELFPEIKLVAHGEGSLLEDTPVPSGQDYGYYKQRFITGEIDYSAEVRLFSVIGYGSYKFKAIYTYRHISNIELLLQYNW